MYSPEVKSAEGDSRETHQTGPQQQKPHRMSTGIDIETKMHGPKLKIH